MGAYRGLAFIIGSEVGYTGFDATYMFLGSKTLGPFAVPLMLPVFFVIVAVFAVIFHYTTYGRRIFCDWK